MTITIIEVAAANFRSDEKTDELNSEFMKRLGMRKRYLPARLALSRSLGVSSKPEIIADGENWGKIIKGDTLFGTGVSLMTWISLIIQHDPTANYDNKTLINVVGAHWRRGLILLDTDWKQTGEDISKFVRRLVEHSELPLSGKALIDDKSLSRSAAESIGLVSVPIGEISTDLSSGASVEWILKERLINRFVYAELSA